MTRKSDLNRHPVIFMSPDDFSELELSVVPDEFGRSSVFFDPKRMSDRSSEQLNPNEVTLQSLLASGVIIDPSRFVNSMGITDAADIEASKGRMSEEMLSYLTAHEEEIKDFVKENNIRQL